MAYWHCQESFLYQRWYLHRKDHFTAAVLFVYRDAVTRAEIYSKNCLIDLRNEVSGLDVEEAKRYIETFCRIEGIQID